MTPIFFALPSGLFAKTPIERMKDVFKTGGRMEREIISSTVLAQIYVSPFFSQVLRYYNKCHIDRITELQYHNINPK